MKIFYVDQYIYPHLDPVPQARLLLATSYLEGWGAEFFKVPVGDSKGTKTINVIISLQLASRR